MDEIERLLHLGRGVVAVRDHPELARRLQRRCVEGRLIRFGVGVYVAVECAEDPETRILAAARWAVDGVLTGRAAARLSFWPEIALPSITLSIPTKRTTVRGVVLARERLPAELLCWKGPLCLTAPALTALDLVSEVGGEGIDRVLLTRRATLAQLHRALELTPGRHGNRDRRLLLHDSRDNPWSEAERLLHSLLRAAGITGWRANVEVWVRGNQYWLDAKFDGLMLAIEVDGYDVHGPHRRGQFERDRRKWSMLTSAGWRLLHFTWLQLRHDPDWVIEMVVSSIDLARAEKARRNGFRRSSGR